MLKVVIIIAALLLGALIIKNVGCGCGSSKEKKDADKKSGCCG